MEELLGLLQEACDITGDDLISVKLFSDYSGQVSYEGTEREFEGREELEIALKTLIAGDTWDGI